MGRARMSGAAVKAKTGKDWQQWFSILDKAGAAKMSHKAIAEYLYGKRGVPGWWSQMVTVTYEQERGLRDKHQKADGYAVSISRTFGVPINILYNIGATKNCEEGGSRTGSLSARLQGTSRCGSCGLTIHMWKCISTARAQ